MPTVIIPTEPVPITPGSPLTYEQGERIVQLLTDFREDVAINATSATDNSVIVTNKLDALSTLLMDIKTNTLPVVYDPSKPTGITFEQADQIIMYLKTIAEFGLYALGMLALWFVIKQLYRFLGGVIFGGV